MSTKCRHYFISGRVQGVFYRGSAQQYASSLGLRGWVRNLVDGRVELQALGKSSQLEQLEKWLKIGPELAKVANIDVIDIDLDDIEQANAISLQISDRFEIRPTTSLSE